MSRSVERRVYDPAAVPAAATAQQLEQIADAFGLLVEANRWYPVDRDRLTGLRGPLTAASIDRAVELGRRMEPVAAARKLLTARPTQWVLDGVAVWESRQDFDAPDLGPVVALARRLWATGADR